MSKSKKRPFYSFLSDGVSFTSNEAAQLRHIYAPMCNPQAGGLKSSITPYLSGDIKLNKDKFLTKPASREDLRETTRNFFVRIHGRFYSLADPLPEKFSCVDIGPFWQRLCKRFPSAGIELEAINFIPSSGEHVELMKVTIKNTLSKKISIEPTAAIAIFGRALANKHDHEHVTSLLHRISQSAQGVLVEHVMAFDEEGHRDNDALYYVLGATALGKSPLGSFPTRESFLGEKGTLMAPQAMIDQRSPAKLSSIELNGKEAFGALRFSPVTLKPRSSASFIIASGIATRSHAPSKTFSRFNSAKKFDEALRITKTYWLNKGRSIEFSTGNGDYDSWLKWVTYQPILRRIFGCSFLPDHDYGKGGKGWRDIWQDLLSLILIEPQEVRGHLVNNFAGVRIDGSNATIIGEKPGEFIADRNKITRVWMDHGAWPLMTLAFYIDQTGDLDVLLKKQSYFRDVQLSRTFEKDKAWDPAYGRKLKDKNGNIYHGTILEHLLVQNLVQFFNVGEHNITRLEGADWNDGLDMAFERGESVAFASFYGGNLLLLADLLERLSSLRRVHRITVAREIKSLLDTLNKSRVNYKSAAAKKRRLFGYFHSVQPEISGQINEVRIKDVVSDLRLKGQFIFDLIHRQEKIKAGGQEWFNGYYDNMGRRVEGRKDKSVRMTLTGQVFPIMSGLADKKETASVIKAANKYLRDKTLGGYRLNSDFGLRHYLEFGRAFGFAYGAKENGAFFSHMTVMYAYALYKQGFAREGYHVLRSVYRMCMDTKRSRIYPGIPEYFDSQGRGMYHYLTGSASWLVLTELTQAFGVRGRCGDLVIDPKLMKEEFAQNGKASVHCSFAGKSLVVVYKNARQWDFGEYAIAKVSLDGRQVPFSVLKSGICIARHEIKKGRKPARLDVELKGKTNPD